MKRNPHNSFFTTSWLLLILTNWSFAVERKINSEEQFAPLCIDLTRRIITDKVGFYQSLKKSSSFEKIPAVINLKTDKKVISLILKSIREKKMAKNFTQKLDAEDKLINGITAIMKKEGVPFMNHCVRLHLAAEKKCQPHISKNFNKFTQCLSSITSENSNFLSKFVPYVRYKKSSRIIASKNKVTKKHTLKTIPQT